MNTLKEVFDHHFKDTKFDKRFADDIKKFISHFFTKNNDHVDFFGGSLIGVHAVRWNYSDTDTWWDDIFNVIPEYVEDDLYKLKIIVPSRHVSSDVLNHAFAYAIYRIHHSKEIPEADKDMAKTRIMLAMNLKFICSLMAHYYRWPADPGVAEKTFNKLTKRFDLKTTGSWGAMLLARSKAWVAKGSRFYNTMINYNDDVDTIKMLNAAQGAIRETFKEINAVYYETLAEDAKILSSSNNVELDGVVVLKDLQRKGTTYNRYIKSVLASKDSFIKQSLIEVVYQAVPSLQPGVFEQILEHVSTVYTNPKESKNINELIDNLLTFSFMILQDNQIADNDLSGALYRLKHVYMSGRITDQQLEKARQYFTKVMESLDKLNKTKLAKSPLIPERCALFLYIVLRTLTINYYK